MIVRQRKRSTSTPGTPQRGEPGIVPWFGLLALLVAPAAAFAKPTDFNALKAMSVEQLLDIEVTSVSKRPEKLSQAPAAIQVITGEDIRRSGATTIPAALKLLSNLDVAQKGAHEWVISARGFSSDV